MESIKKLLVWIVALSSCISCGNRELNVAIEIR